MKSTALVLAGAECVWEDLAALEELMGVPWPGVVVVVNDLGAGPAKDGRRWEGRVDHWATLHGEKMAAWRQARERAGLPGGYRTWSCANRSTIDHHWNQREWTNGSSGMYAVGVALVRLGHPRVVACGVPMTPAPNAFSGRAWASHKRYHRGWLGREVEPLLRRSFRSMSGWTRQYFGAPTLEWVGLVSG